MPADFPIGTRLRVNNKTLEIVEDISNEGGCNECALKGWANGAVGAMIYPSTLCMSLVCRKRGRLDGKNVHWELKNG